MSRKTASGLLSAELEVRLPDLDRQAFRPHGAEGEWWIVPGEDRQVERAGRVLEDLDQQFVDLGVGDPVVVVQDEDERFADRFELVGQSIGHLGRCGKFGGTHEVQAALTGSWRMAAHRGHEVGEKRARVVVVVVQRQPHTGERAALEPLRHQGALAVASRRRDQGQRPANILFQPLQEARPGNDVAADERRVQLRRAQWRAVRFHGWPFASRRPADAVFSQA